MGTRAFPPSIQTARATCDHCGQDRTVAHVSIAHETDTWLLCPECILANHTDDEVRAALTAHRDAAHAAYLAGERLKREEEGRPHVPPPPEPYSRRHAAGVVVRNWDQGEIDDRQADRLCAAIWAGDHDDPGTFYRAITDARVRHAARMHRDLGPRDPTRKHRSGLRYAWLHLDAAGLWHLIYTIRGTLAGRDGPFRHDWQRAEWEARGETLTRRYRRLTGGEWSPCREKAA